MHDLHALVVDDSKVGRLTMMKKLDAMGMKVDLAESGQQALDFLAQHRPDIIFMDQMMPEMDGFEVTRRIKASPATRDIPIIIISGNDDADFVREARAAGAIDAIAKPPVSEVLESLLAALPKPAMAETAAVVAPPAPQPEAFKPVPSPSVDMVELQTLIERLVEATVSPIRADVIAEIDQRLAPEAANQRKAIAEWTQRLNLHVTAMAELKREVAHINTLDKHLRNLEQRHLALEAEVARPRPDFDAVQANLEQQVATRLSQIRTEHQAIQAELGELRERQSDARLRQLVAQTLASLKPVEQAPAADRESGQSELDQLRRKVKSLAIATAIGGVLLLGVIGMMVFGG